ncbi:hypothetical protein V490_07561 [Pseudogymnoascus sp. VKM F-3557]|nr:hypothetical protein V490_07561 [Pseudogymnoascus sp. VKM F-3557]
MADAKSGNSGGDHSSGEYSGTSSVIQNAHIAQSGQARLTENITIAKSPGKGRDIGIVLSSGDNVKKDREERKAKKDAAEKEAAEKEAREKHQK